MSEYIFSYTQGSGSGSGSEMVPSVPCDLSCPLPSEYPLIEYRRTNIDSNGNPIEYPIDSADICCPIVSRLDDFEELPCKINSFCLPFYGNLRPNEAYDTNHFYKRYGDGTIEGDFCCPIVTLTTEPSGVPCENCTDYVGVHSEEQPCTYCVNEECVELSPEPCSPLSWDEYAKLYPGVSPSTHYIKNDTLYCAEDPLRIHNATPCPLIAKDLLLDPTDPFYSTNIIDVQPNSVSFYESETQYGSIVKEGSGTLVITEYTGAKLLQCNNGTIIINNPAAFDPDLTVMVEKDGVIVCNFGSQKMNVRAVFFGTEDNTAYLSEIDLPTFSGKIDLGFGGITVARNGFPYLRNLLISGRNGGTWDGSVGITTSANKNNIKNIGYIINPNGSITVSWAIPGDTTLDGKVDMFDIVKILASGKYNSGATDAQWFDGDSNYDGRVDIIDIVSILSTGEYNQGSYLPVDKNFKLSWNPPNKFFGNNAPNLELSTKDTSKRSIEIVYDPTFKVWGQDKNIVCTPMSEIDCKQIAGSLFKNDNIPCTDSSCENLEIAKPRMGACCLPEGCKLIKDGDNTLGIGAYELCENSLQGVWLGYNTVCNDSSCTENSKKIIRG